jgi:hypothetical protein
MEIKATAKFAQGVGDIAAPVVYHNYFKRAPRRALVLASASLSNGGRSRVGSMTETSGSSHKLRLKDGLLITLRGSWASRIDRKLDQRS